MELESSSGERESDKESSDQETGMGHTPSMLLILGKDTDRENAFKSVNSG